VAGTLIAGVGHRFWRDYSVGPEWCDRLARLSWPEGVVVEDYSFGALAMAQRLEDEPYRRAIFICGEERGREPASLHLRRYRHQPERLSTQRVQDHLFEAVAGVIAIDLLLVTAGHFGVLPPETWVIEYEPADNGWGHGLSAAAEQRYPKVLGWVRDLASGVIPESVVLS
jgi:Ni,Fe-hydrogenase maturation factor